MASNNGIAATSSWTNWFNGIVGLASQLPNIGAWMTSHASYIVPIMGLINLILRNFKTSAPVVSILPEK